MPQCLSWMVATALSALVLVGLHAAHVLQGLALLISYGVGYALVAATLLLALLRCRQTWHPALRRMVALLSGAALAGIDVMLVGLTGEAAQQAFFSALLGVALVQVLAKTRDRRVREPEY